MIGPLPVYMELVGDVKMNRIALPIGSMYGILTYILFTYIYHSNQLFKRSANMAYMDPMGCVCVWGGANDTWYF